MAVLNLLCCPFILLFLIIYFFMKNAERFYHHPSSAGARQWSSLAAWRLREFNELPHYLNHRCVQHPLCLVVGFVLLLLLLSLSLSSYWRGDRGEEGWANESCTLSLRTSEARLHAFYMCSAVTTRCFACEQNWLATAFVATGPRTKMSAQFSHLARQGSAGKQVHASVRAIAPAKGGATWV
jgi:hypothetical protein